MICVLWIKLFRDGKHFVPLENNKLNIHCHSECDISISKLLGFETFPFFLMVSVSVSKNFGIEKSIGIGFGKFWFQKKYRYRFRKKLVSKKVSDSVSKNSGIEKSIGIGIGKHLVSKKVSDSVSTKIGIGKSFGFGFVQILGFATHWLLVAKVGGIRGSSWSSWCWKEQGKKLLISASANLQWVSVRHLLVKVIHRPKEELSQLTRQVAKASNWWLVQRPTLLGGDIIKRPFENPKGLNIVFFLVLTALPQPGW